MSPANAAAPRTMTRRTLRLPVLIATLLVAAVMAPGVYFAHAWQLSRLSRALPGHAQREQELGHWAQAASFLDQFLRIRPRDATVRGQLAMVYAKGSETLAQKKRAVQLYYRALGAGPQKI